MQLGPQILLAAGGQLLDPAELAAPPAAAPKRTKISAMVQVCAAVMAAQSARPGALNMPGSGALAAAAGPKGKGSEGAMQDRPLRCQHGRRWSQSARARWCCISWRSGGRLAVPGPKSDRAAPSWRGWVAQKSAAHHAMVPMQLNKHCHSRDLAARIPAMYFALHWPIVALFTRMRNIFCHLTVDRAQRQHELSALSSQLKNRRQKKITSPHVARHAVQAMACAIRTTKEDDALLDCDMVRYKQVRAVARQKAGFARQPGRCWGNACRAGELHGLHPATARALLGGCLDRDGSPGRRFYQRR